MDLDSYIRTKQQTTTLPYIPSIKVGTLIKGDYGHYHSQLGFSILMGRGFIQGARVFKRGTWTPPKAVFPKTFARNFFCLVC